MKCFLMVCAALLGCALPSTAQVIFGSIQGTVLDESGSIVPGVQVTLKNMDTGLASKTASNSAGIYFLAELRPGRYQLEAERDGFAKFVQSGITVRIEDRLRIDVRLRVGQVTEKVQVTAEAPLLQTEQTTLGKVVDETSIKQLPLSGRNAFALVTLVPGVQQRSGDEQPRLSGGRARTGEFVVDGSSITEARRGEVQTQPNLDAIQEFKVQTNGLSAEFGRTAGGVVNAAMKSGTNQFHGNVFEFFRNDTLNARNFFASSVPKLRQNQFGGTLGGPVRKDRTFFFLAYEGFRRRGQSNFNLTVPTAAMKQGDFSALIGSRAGADALGRDVFANQVFDPLTLRKAPNGRDVRDPFPGNIIPATRFDPASKVVASLYPDPNMPGLAQNFRILKPSGSTNNRVDTRVDQRFSDRDLFFVRFSLDNQESLVARPFTYAVSGGRKGDFNRYKNGSVNWTRTLTPTTINDVRFAFYRAYEERLFDEAVNPSTLGIPNLGERGMPRFDVSGFTGIGDVVIRSPAQEQYQLQDVATLVRGRHIVKIGADVRRFRINDLQLSNNGSYTFSTVQTADPFSGRGGHPVASLLLGQVDTFNNDPNRGRYYHRSSHVGAFIQDDFKVSPTLTVNIGMRYEMEQEPNETRWNGSNFDLQTGRVVTMRNWAGPASSLRTRTISLRESGLPGGRSGRRTPQCAHTTVSSTCL